MITAEEARNGTPRTYAKEHLKFIESEIIKSVEANKSEVIIFKNPYWEWLASKPTEEGKKVIETLRKNGFKLYLHEEHSFNMYVSGMKISWSSGNVSEQTYPLQLN